MRATELIGDLQALVAAHGDLPVTASCMDEEVKTISVLNEDSGPLELYTDTVAAEFFIEG